MNLKNIFKKIFTKIQKNQNTIYIEKIDAQKTQLAEYEKQLEVIHKDAAKLYENVGNLHRGNTCNFSFTYRHLKRHLELEEKDKINGWKKLSLIWFVPFLIFLYLIFSNNIFSNFDFNSIQKQFDYDMVDKSQIFILSLLGMIITHIIALLSHLIIYLFNFRDKRTYKGKKKYLDDKSKLNQLLYFLFSPDLFYANFFKFYIKQNILYNLNYKKYSTYKDDKDITPNQWNAIKIDYSSFISKSNWLNVIISIGLSLIFVFLTLLKDLDSIPCLQILLSIILFRILSRGIEISIAFYKDIVRVDSKLFISLESTYNNSDNPLIDSEYFNGFKSSLLRQSARLSLAVHSLIELFITYALAYFLLFNLLSNIDSSFFIKDSQDLLLLKNEVSESMSLTVIDESLSISAPSFIEMLFFSSSLGLFNISYGAYQNILLAILHFSQILLSAVLILLSIAQYISNDKTLSVEDKAFYRIKSLIKAREKRNLHYEEKDEDDFLI
ncbi:hypothetical protein [Lysinibacillus fusiformis]|uniref:hypothetical protein n=1 Tax=Lysinibacillus fusiformis TaxID=28031 RepID=UPI00148E6E0F|nr:hypothetical protein [Lysinibacillus fusiformis]NOG28993.1 hypothetical protein [Lysinibacillus fusiformis]